MSDKPVTANSEPAKPEAAKPKAANADATKAGISQESTAKAGPAAGAATKPTETAKHQPAAKKRTDSHRSPLSLLAMLIALLAAGAAGYGLWLLQIQVPLGAQLVKTQAALQTQVAQLEQGLQLSRAELTKQTRAQQVVEDELQTLGTAMQDLSASLGRSTVAWRMAEVEYLLTVANHRLILAQDRETAIAIFETADERIRAIGDTSLLKVRKAIADELQALRALPEVDVAGLALRVGSLLDSVEQLPLRDKNRIAAATRETSAETPPADWQQFALAVWNDLKSLVQVRRHQQPTEPLLPPDQTRHLYQNLSLKLEQARLAVLQRDTALFHQYLTEAEDWIRHYFEAESAAVVNALTTLDTLADSELRPTMPDVSASLRLLREVMQQQRTATRVDSKQGTTE
ncbi:MAG: uroporphyrinogen-III C-methyltransferase [Gammaproteobacteria bacterium]|nr:uroporphyrinogen-III C-methyltransferase [Gammaproteobacteria bacterium]